MQEAIAPGVYFQAAPIGSARCAVEHVLSLEERAYWDALPTAERRSEWLAGRVLAKQLVLNHLLPRTGCSLAQIKVATESSGAPIIRWPGGHTPSVSISHTRHYAASAVAVAGQVGVDIERVEPRPLDQVRFFVSPEELPLLDSFLGGGETALTGLWTLKEAALKAIRVGLRIPPTAVTVDVGADAAIRIGIADGGTHRVARGWVALTDDYLAAVVVTDDQARGTAW